MGTIIFFALVVIGVAVLSGAFFDAKDYVDGTVCLLFSIVFMAALLLISLTKDRSSDTLLTPSIEVNCIDSVCDTTYIYKFYASEKE